MAAVFSVLTGCTTTGIALSAAGVATDTSVTWDIVKHLHAKMTEGDPLPCWRLDSVQRALNPRCGAFVPGSLRASDLRTSQLQECPLATVVRDPQLWPALAEFLDKGAQPEACARSPLVELAQAAPRPARISTPRHPPPCARCAGWPRPTRARSTTTWCAC